MWRGNDVPREGELFPKTWWIRFILEQKGGSIEMLTRLAGLPFLEDRVTLHAGQLFFI